MEKALFIAAIFNLEIEGDTGDGIEMREGVLLCNNTDHIHGLLNEGLSLALGNLEFNALVKAKAIFYRIGNPIGPEGNPDDLLSDFLVNCEMVLLDLWMLQDHAIDVMLGFVQWPYYYNNIVIPAYDESKVHSNWITASQTNARGKNSGTLFTIAELTERARPTRAIYPFSKPDEKSTAFHSSVDRFNRASAFVQSARNSIDLGFKVAHYCSALESLLGTDSAELTHKLSERVAWLIGADIQDRITIYRSIKTLYGIRSKVVHGSAVAKAQLRDLSTNSAIGDDIIRKLFRLIEMDVAFDQMLRSDNEVLDAKFLALVFGQKRNEL